MNYANLDFLNHYQSVNKQNIKFTLAKIIWCFILLFITYFVSYSIKGDYFETVMGLFQHVVVLAIVIYAVYALTNFICIIIHKTGIIKRENESLLMITKVIFLSIDFVSYFFSMGLITLLLAIIYSYNLAEYAILILNKSAQFDVILESHTESYVVTKDILYGFGFLVSAGVIALSACFMALSKLIMLLSTGLIDGLLLFVVGTKKITRKEPHNE